MVSRDFGGKLVDLGGLGERKGYLIPENDMTCKVVVVCGVAVVRCGVVLMCRAHVLIGLMFSSS